ncbi:MAG TPA: EAL domain-containing protein [Solirubrobacterales bacterium]|nr:EAL domain-containing protein [Solirubrobacterales bacterium]
MSALGAAFAAETTIVYGLCCALGAAIVLASSGEFSARRVFGQGVGVCALGLATAWSWFFFSPGGSTAIGANSGLDLLLALAVLIAVCNHGWPLSPRFALLGGGFALIALGDALRVSLLLDGTGDLLPFLGVALVVASCLGIGTPVAGPRSGRLGVGLALLAVLFAVVALVYDHYSRLSSGTVLLASLTVAGAGLRLTLAQRGWRDARARARRAELPSAATLPTLDAAIALGPDNRVVSCNELAKQVFRRDQVEILGEPVGTLLGGPGGRSFEDLLADADSLTVPLSVELSAYDGQGAGFPVEVGIGPASGEATMRILVVRDISERRRREEDNRRLAAIIRSSEDAVLTKDLAGVITAWNQGAEGLYGYRAEEAIGRPVTELIIPTERWSEAQRVLGIAATGETISFETQRITKDGSLIDVSLRAFPIRGVSGEVTAVCTVGHDVSDRRRRERAETRDAEAQLWRRRLTEALAAEDLVFHGQPILDLGDHSIHHHELLVRMKLGNELVPPIAFLPYAEESELIRDLDLWAVETGMGLASRVPVAINLSARSLGSRSLLGAIERKLGDDGVPAGNVTFEITETAAAENMRGARELVAELSGLGCAVALDDFGTGYGSFTYLRHLPVTQLKIDIEFIRGIDQDPADRRVVESMVGVARNFAMTTVAEGVEDERTLELVREMGVDLAQGYYVGRPRPLEIEVEARHG